MAQSDSRDALTIAPDVLAAMLERGDQVTILDIRPESEREEWHIPGSIHHDAYEALKRHDPNALEGLDLPAEGPVITVCAAGNTSRTAAAQLRAEGVEALSVEGGMKAWSLVANTADVPLKGTSARVVQVRRTGKGCLSYLIGADGDAAVVDASLPPDTYVRLASERGWQITQILDTHIHADHLSRARALAEETGAAFFLPAQERARFSHDSLRDGDALTIGDARLRSLLTPGHTAESTCYLLDDAALFTGDTLFVDGLGRPDLDDDAGQVRMRAEALYDSLHRLLRVVDPEVIVLPGHTSHPVPFDGRMIGSALGDVRARLASLSMPKEAFVNHLLARIPPTPPNFERIVALNEAGATVVDEILDLEAGANRCAVS